jgi:hypothetical protein
MIQTGQQKSPWLFDTGAGISVISEKLYRQLKPLPPINPSEYSVTGANRKPLKILGQTRLKVQALEFCGEIEALICSELSQNAILGMDAIKQIKLALNPISEKFFHVNAITKNQIGILSKKTTLLAFEVRNVKIHTPEIMEGTVLVTPSPAVEEIWK